MDLLEFKSLEGLSDVFLGEFLGKRFDADSAFCHKDIISNLVDHLSYLLSSVITISITHRMSEKPWKISLDGEDRVKLIKQADCSNYASLRLRVEEKWKIPS